MKPSIPIEQTMAELQSFLCLDVGKITEKMKIEMNQAFWMIVNKATFLEGYDTFINHVRSNRNHSKIRRNQKSPLRNHLF